MHIAAHPDDWMDHAGVVARLLNLMGYIADQVHNSEHLHRALRPEFARIVEAADL